MANKAETNALQPKAYCVAVKEDDWGDLSYALDRLRIKHQIYGHDDTWNVIKIYLPPRSIRHNYTQALEVVGVFD
jgi:hypothetical protein